MLVIIMTTILVIIVVLIVIVVVIVMIVKIIIIIVLKVVVVVVIITLMIILLIFIIMVIRLLVIVCYHCFSHKGKYALAMEHKKLLACAWHASPYRRRPHTLVVACNMTSQWLKLSIHHVVLCVSFLLFGPYSLNFLCFFLNPSIKLLFVFPKKNNFQLIFTEKY